MISQSKKVIFAASMVALVGTGTAFAQSPEAAGSSDHHTDSEAAGASPNSSSMMAPGGSGPMAGAGSMSGGGMMMSPEMMQMMIRMMNNREMPGMAGRGMPGMMRGNAMPMCSIMGDCGDSGTAGAGHRMGGMIYGMPEDDQIEMTPERVREFIQRRLAWHGNPRLKIGEIATASDGRITAEIVTLDGSLVQKLAFNRYPGLFRVITE